MSSSLLLLLSTESNNKVCQTHYGQSASQHSSIITQAIIVIIMHVHVHVKYMLTCIMNNKKMLNTNLQRVLRIRPLLDCPGKWMLWTISKENDRSKTYNSVQGEEQKGHK